MRKHYMCDVGPPNSTQGTRAHHGKKPVHLQFSGKFGNNLGQYWMAAHLSKLYGNGNIASNMDKGTKQKLNMGVYPVFPGHPSMAAENNGKRNSNGVVDSQFVIPKRATCVPSVAERIKSLKLVTQKGHCYSCRCWEKESWCSSVEKKAHLGATVGGEMFVRGQHFAHELWMRYGNAMRSTVIKALAPPTKFPWLSNDDVVVHIRVCAPPKGQDPNKPFIEAGVRLYLPPTFFDTLFGKYMTRPVKNIWVVQGREHDGGGPCNEPQKYAPYNTALLKHLGEKWGAKLVQRMETHFDLLRTAKRVVVAESSTYSCWAAYLNTEAEEFHVPVQTPDSGSGCVLLLDGGAGEKPPGEAGAASAGGRSMPRTFLHAPLFGLWNGTMSSADSSGEARGVEQRRVLQHFGGNSSSSDRSSSSSSGNGGGISKTYVSADKNGCAWEFDGSMMNMAVSGWADVRSSAKSHGERGRSR